MSKYRQHIMVGLLVAMVLYWGGEWFYAEVVQAPVAKRYEMRKRLVKGIRTRIASLKAAEQDKKLLAAWMAQSLPSNGETARSGYQAWLWELTSHIDLTGPSVNAGTPLERKGMYQEISFTVSGLGTLPQITKFLFEFYNAPHLHQIRTLTIIPVADTDQFDMSMTIRALAIRGMQRKDRLATKPFDRLALPELADYDHIAQRNLFSLGGSPDATEYTYLDGVVSVDGKPQAWFTHRATGESQHLCEGDPLQIGPFHGTIAEIHGNDVIIRSENEHGQVERWLVTMGENLSQAHALPPGY